MDNTKGSRDSQGRREPAGAGEEKKAKKPSKGKKSLDYPGCPQCGARELTQDGQFLRCTYCNSVFEVLPENKPRVLICSGANVEFGKNCEIRGSIKIEPGAKVKFKGRLKLVPQK